MLTGSTACPKFRMNVEYIRIVFSVKVSSNKGFSKDPNHVGLQQRKTFFHYEYFCRWELVKVFELVTCSGNLTLIDLLLMMTGGGWIETAKMLSDMVIKKMMVSIPEAARTWTMQWLLLI